MSAGCIAMALMWVTTSTPACGPDDTELDELLEALEVQYDDKDDVGAASTMTKLVGFAETFEEPKDKRFKTIAKAIERAVHQKRAKGETALYQAAVVRLGALGPEGAKATVRSLKKAHVRDHADVLSAALESLGSHAEVKYLRLLTGYLTHKEGVVVGAAGRGLAAYTDTPERQRKQIVSDVVQVYNSMDASSRGGGPRQNGGGGGGQGGGSGGGQGAQRSARAKLGLAKPGLESALQALTGQRHAGPAAWTKWFRENKSKRWD